MSAPPAPSPATIALTGFVIDQAMFVTAVFVTFNLA